MAGALDRPERDIRFVLCLREDYLAQLDEAREALPDVLANSYRLRPLDRGNARLAITEPAARAGVLVEPGLVDMLVGEEGKPPPQPSPASGGGQPVPRAQGVGGGGDLVEADGTVPPPALQIVMDKIYRQALSTFWSAGKPPELEGRLPDAPPEGLTLALSDYESLEGAGAILAAYVDDGLDKLKELRAEDGAPLNADRRLAEAMLKVMVTSQKTKAALTHAGLVEGLAEAGELDPADKADCDLAERTRRGLEQVRLLRGFQREGAALYELAHDHVAREVARRISEAEMEAKVARELLHREMDNWKHAKLLIPLEALKLIHERREELRRLTPDELELIFRSALAHGYETGYWFERACEQSVPADGIALEGLRSDNFRTRATAVRSLAQFACSVIARRPVKRADEAISPLPLGDCFAAPSGRLAMTPDGFIDAIIAMLADVYPQVRAAAIVALEKLQPTGEWRTHLKYECYVPAGEFVMGSADSDRDSKKDERPQHRVYVEAFYIGKYPITNSEYKRYMDDLGRVFAIPSDKDNHPVVEVSWYDARDYAAWAGMRLLTEAEWEKAASWDDKVTGRQGDKERGRPGGKQRATRNKKRIYPWGDEFDKARCNTSESRIGTTTLVGKYSLDGDSPYGVADMAGNVWEWTSSLRRQYPYKADDGREDMSSSGSRVLRGGSFYNTAADVHCAPRSDDDPYNRHDHWGFRVGWRLPSS